MITSPGEFENLLGQSRGPTGWTTLDQSAVDDFARITNDPQWIHVDTERAKASPFGGTIVHGYFTLAMIAPGLAELFPLSDRVVSINYGLNRVRFPAPVPVGGRLRMTATVAHCRPQEHGMQVEYDAIVECEGLAKPACVARPVLLYTADQDG